MFGKMNFRVVNIVDSLDALNFGIWNAAISSSRELQEGFRVSSELVGPAADWDDNGYVLDAKHFVKSSKPKVLERLLIKGNWSPKDTVIATHGCWRWPTRWGMRLRSKGYAWVHSPQGMLEPWSFGQRRLKKWIYFRLFESRMLRCCSILRAVSAPECKNLVALLPACKSVRLIPNGVDLPRMSSVSEHLRLKRRIVFLGRLHKKKGPAVVAQAFISSLLHNREDFELVIAGPDQGEAGEIQAAITNAGSRNIRLIGAVYGAEKEILLKSATYFVLPSASEGFPTAVIEAMSYGCFPLISNGCNFPEAAAVGLSRIIDTDAKNIAPVFDSLLDDRTAESDASRDALRSFVSRNYSMAEIARLQFEAYEELISCNRRTLICP